MRPEHRSPVRREHRDGDALECKHFGTCGGCSSLDQPIRWQLSDKVAACERLLAVALDGRSIAYTLPDRTPRWFRTRLLYPVRKNHKGAPSVGLFTFRTNELVRIDECQTADPWLTALGLVAERIIRDLRLQPWDPVQKRGHVMAFWARLASGTGEIMAGLVTRPGVFPLARAFADALTEGAARIATGRRARKLVGVVHSVSDRDDDFLLGDRHTPLVGREYIVDRRDELELRISAGSFYQIHAGAYALLYGAAMALCGDVTGLRIVDGYGGVGAFGLRFARAGAAAVTIVEDNAAACRDAEHNAKANALPAVTVVNAAFAKAKFAAEPDLMVVDPPRSGLRQAGVKRVLAARPHRLLHVACDAESLARDLAGLRAGGYALDAVQLCDLFPHTEHVELLAMLRRID